MSELAETPPPPSLPPRPNRPVLSAVDWPDWNDWRINPPIPVRSRPSLSITLNMFGRDLNWNPFELSAQFDALQSDYYTRLNSALQANAAGVLQQLCSALCEADKQRVLRNVAAWAAFRNKPSGSRSRSRYRIASVTTAASGDESSESPFMGRRLYVLTAALASAMGSDDGALQTLAHALCRHFIDRIELTGTWGSVLRVLVAQSHKVSANDAGTRFPRLYEARGYLTESTRVRLKLYWQHHQRPLNVLRLLNAVAYLPGISWQIKSREIRRFLDARRSMGQPVSPLRLRHLEWLRERELRLVVRRPELMDALIGHAGTQISTGCAHSDIDQAKREQLHTTFRNTVHERANAMLDRYALAMRYLQRLRRAIDIRNWPIASECISDIRRLNPPRRWIYLQLRFAGCDGKGRLDYVPDMDAESFSKRAWKPMPKTDYDWLVSNVSAKVLERMEIGIPPWMDMKQATDALLRKRIASNRLTPLERQLLFNAMTHEQWTAIDSAGRIDLLMDNGPLWSTYDLDKALLLAARSERGQATVMHRAGQARYITPLLRQMAAAQAAGRYVHDATRLLTVILSGRSDMGKDTAQPWYLPFIGLPEWQTIERHFDGVKPVLTDALLHVKGKGRLYNREGYFKRLQQWNADIGQTFPASLFDVWCTLAQLAPDKAFEKLPARQALHLLSDIDNCPALLAALAHLYHRDLEAEILVTRAWRTTQDEALWMLLTDAKWRYRPHRDSKAARVPAHLILSAGASDNKLPDSVLDLHIAFVRQDPHALKLLAKHTDPVQLEEAFWRVAQRLAESHPRDAAFLQMLALLGADMAAQLSVLIARAGKVRNSGPTRNHVAQGQTIGHALDTLYENRDIPKRNGATRTLHIPTPLLKVVQKRIVQRALAPLGAHRCATGFVKGISIADNASPHAHQAVVASCDIRNCFPGVPARKVWHVLSRDLAQVRGHALSPTTIYWLVQLCCAHGALPIGAPTSPALLNRVLFDLDESMAVKAVELGCRYTRYADDLCFSGSDDCVKLIGMASRKLKALGLELDPQKTNVFRRGRRQMVTGLCVNDGIHIPRTQRKRLRAALHRAAIIEQAVADGQNTDALAKPFLNGKELNANMLQGHVAWHHFIKRKRRAALQ